jgi:hypothetical protein
MSNYEVTEADCYSMFDAGLVLGVVAATIWPVPWWGAAIVAVVGVASIVRRTVRS